MAVPSLAHPGQLLGLSSAYIPGPGTHLYGKSIIASLAGRPVIVPAAPLPSLSNPSNPAPSISNSLLPILTIPRVLPSPTSPIPSGAVSNTNTLPAVGSIVLCRVTRLTPRQVDVLILVVGEDVCGEEWRGVLRREDVRIGDKGESAAEGFRVGDLVRGRVISLGDQSTYYLSTEGNHLGVFMAKSDAGNEMFPISWKEFIDPVTGLTETRKVAKPF